ncbi:hypothetical protein FE257_005483 [Aspergillus nanangensis]|uniref:Mediator of RNA polymerase II transcription subunit 20 n=1 Tax=Aspergillus nanangensis TaxID=2582783 RepID=A0AAD4GVK0_ASPNN|nr:hypothetical protein FE257_005483 [Aspergillus nanangensis]
MPITGVFFIPSNPNASTVLSTVTERLHSNLADEPVPIGRWALEHKLMRDTPSCLPASTSERPANPRYMQFLSLSYCPNHGFIYTSNPEKGTPQLHQHQQQQQQQHTPIPGPGAPGQMPTLTPGSGGVNVDSTAPLGMVMTTVPLPSCATLFQHFVYACQPFWCHRHTVTVPGGMVYDVGDFRVRVGDVRQSQPTGRVRGTVVEIEWRGPSVVASITAQYTQQQRLTAHFEDTGGVAEDDDSGIDVLFAAAIEDADIDAEYATTAVLIREFWSRLGIEGAREAILVPDVGKEVKEQLRRLKMQADHKPSRMADGEGSGQPKEEDPDPDAGVDVARQFMEILRFNR